MNYKQKLEILNKTVSKDTLRTNIIDVYQDLTHIVSTNGASMFVIKEVKGPRGYIKIDSKNQKIEHMSKTDSFPVWEKVIPEKFKGNINLRIPAWFKKIERYNIPVPIYITHSGISLFKPGRYITKIDARFIAPYAGTSLFIHYNTKNSVIILSETVIKDKTEILNLECFGAIMPIASI